VTTTKLKYCLSLAFIACLFTVQVVAQTTKDGYTKFNYANGKVSSEGTIRQGKPDGYWKSYYEDGKIKSEGNRKDFMLDSTWKFYNENGLMYLSYTYKASKKYGIKSTYTPDPKDSSKGILASTENYVNDTLQGNGYYYKDGKLHQIIPYLDGLAQGRSLQFSPDSLITEIITYKGGFIKKIEKINQYNTQGHKEGLWQTFYANMAVKWEGTYEDGKREGYFKTYNEEGSLLTIDKYINDVLQSNAPELAKLEIKTQYNSNGTVQETGPYKNGLPYGAHRIYDTNGVEQKAEVYDSGRVVAEGILDESSLEEGYWKEFHPNGAVKSEGKYVHGVRVGEWKFYYQNSNKFEIGKYNDKGKPIGHWMWYYEDGKTLRESNFHDGLQDGDFVEYSDSGGVITQGQYLDGLKEGTWTYKNGNYKSIGKYVDDMQDSVWREFYISSGRLRFTGAYTQGRPDGKHLWFYPNGRKELEGQYSQGLMEDKWKYYNELDGTIFLTITYKDDVELRYDQTKVEP
jgi:antitoxin component YwqK of YwqJK toxin-antitoxin module